MVYLSQLVGTPIYFNGKRYGKLIDLSLSFTGNAPFVANAVIRRDWKKYVVDYRDVEFLDKKTILKKAAEIPVKKYDDKTFYLVEDLLDKQVIDITGRKLVRVNDVLLKQHDQLQVTGIDIGLSGILRRLGLGFFNLKTITLPWSLIEAFDYQTGNVHIKLSYSSLDTFHPAEIADILEEAGTKERIGIVEALSLQKAASAIEEANEETQAAILEEIPKSRLKHIVERMHLSEIADIWDILNSLTHKFISNALGSEKEQKVKKLISFKDDAAGGLMVDRFLQIDENATIQDALDQFPKSKTKPEIVIIIDKRNKLIGKVQTKNLLGEDLETPLKNYIKGTDFVYEHTPFEQIIRRFASYDLRGLPVIDTSHKVVGVITIDSVINRILEEEEEKDEVL